TQNKSRNILTSTSYSLILHHHLHTSLSLFFTTRYLHHRHPHSFPTRRSSDLGDTRARTEDNYQKAVLTEEERRFFSGLGQVKNRDRKSTRLNSSHVKISYAVFCLKKKKKTKDEDI